MIIPENGGQVNWIFSGLGLPTGAQVTCGFITTNYEGTIDDAAEFLAVAWQNNVLPQQVDDITLDKVLVKFGPNDLGPQTEAPSNEAGGGTGSGLAPNCALLVRKITISGGRAGRGRMFIPGLAEADVDSAGNVDSGAVGAFQGGLDDLFGDMVAEELNPMLLHGEDSPLEGLTQITSFQVQNVAATQRRRLRR